jgi:hypothetical protein
METQRNELDEASYQLMMDIQTGRVLEPSRPARGRKLLGLTLALLGGLTGLLVASGHLTSETANIGKSLVPPLTTLAPQRQVRDLSNKTDRLPPSTIAQADALPTAGPSKEHRAADVQQASPRRTDPRAKKPASPAGVQDSSKSAKKPPMRVGKANRGCNCPIKNPPRKVAQHRSYEPSVRSPAYDFDRNAELVRSTP